MIHCVLFLEPLKVLLNVIRTVPLRNVKPQLQISILDSTHSGDLNSIGHNRKMEKQSKQKMAHLLCTNF